MQKAGFLIMRLILASAHCICNSRVIDNLSAGFPTRSDKKKGAVQPNNRKRLEISNLGRRGAVINNHVAKKR